MNNNSNPLVSIVMPSYNSEKYIRESIDSIIAQTFQDWELLIVDGHSTDNTQNIIQEYLNKDTRIKLLLDEKKGIGPALHQGCMEARGKYIARMDTDDISLPHRLDVQVNYLENHPNVGLVSCFSEYMDKNGKSLGYKFQYSSEFVIKRDPSNIFHPGVVMRKVTYMETGGYPPLKRAEDLFLWYRLLKLSKVKVIEKPLVKYRMSDDSLSNSMSEYFRKNVNSLWSIIAQKKNVSQEDIEYLNNFIKENITYNSPSDNPVRKNENIFVGVMNMFMTKNAAFKIFFLFKNIFGIFRFGINY